MSPGFVIDCSVTMAWCFSDEATPATAALQQRLISEAALVPALWMLEVANVLAIAERRGRISAAESAEFLARLAVLDIRVDGDSSWQRLDRILSLCRAHRLTSYDAAYLDASVRAGIPLATLDSDLRAAASQLGLRVLGSA